MSRWGKPTKNKRRLTEASIKYRLDESWDDFKKFVEQLKSSPEHAEWAELAQDLAGSVSQMMHYGMNYRDTLGAEHFVIAAIEEAGEMMRMHMGSNSTVEQAALEIEEMLMEKGWNKTDWTGLDTTNTKRGHYLDKESQSIAGIAESKQPTTKTLMEGFNRFLNEGNGGFAMGGDDRHPNPGRPNVEQLNVAEIGPVEWLTQAMNIEFTSTSMGDGGGMDLPDGTKSDNTTSLAKMFRNGDISDSNDMQRHLEEIMYEDGMPDDEIQEILAHLKDAMYEEGLV